MASRAPDYKRSRYDNECYAMGDEYPCQENLNPFQKCIQRHLKTVPIPGGFRFQTNSKRKELRAVIALRVEEMILAMKRLRISEYLRIGYRRNCGVPVPRQYILHNTCQTQPNITQEMSTENSDKQERIIENTKKQTYLVITPDGITYKANNDITNEDGIISNKPIENLITSQLEE